MKDYDEHWALAKMWNTERGTFTGLLITMI